MIRVLIVSGNANNGSKAGFIVNANNDSSNDNPNIGTHLCLFSDNHIHPATRQNTKQTPLQFGMLAEELGAT